MYTHTYSTITLCYYFGRGQGLLVHSVCCRRDDACLMHVGKASTTIFKKTQPSYSTQPHLQQPYTLLPSMNLSSHYHLLALTSIKLIFYISTLHPFGFSEPPAHNTPLGAFTWPEAHSNLLWCHLDDIRACSTGALAAEGQAPKDMGAAGGTLDLTSTAISDEVCFQVTTRGDRPWIAKVLGGETRQKQAGIRVGLRPCTPSSVFKSGQLLMRIQRMDQSACYLGLL